MIRSGKTGTGVLQHVAAVLALLLALLLAPPQGLGPDWQGGPQIALQAPHLAAVAARSQVIKPPASQPQPRGLDAILPPQGGAVAPMPRLLARLEGPVRAVPPPARRWQPAQPRAPPLQMTALTV